MEAVSAVESLRSVKTRVTTLRISVGGRTTGGANAAEGSPRTAGAGGAATAEIGVGGGARAVPAVGAVAAARGVPQKPQSRNFEGFSSPQLAQTTVSGTGASDVPQNPHRRNFAGFSSPQDGH